MSSPGELLLDILVSVIHFGPDFLGPFTARFDQTESVVLRRPI